MKITANLGPATSPGPHSNYSIIDIVSDLQTRGFCLDFTLIGSKLFCVQEQCFLRAEEFEVREMYRFRIGGSAHPEILVFAIESSFLPLKGILLNSNGQIRYSVKRFPSPPQKT
jgi:hypothetical protein